MVEQKDNLEAEARRVAAGLTADQRRVVITGNGDRITATEVFGIEPSLFNLWTQNDGHVTLTGRSSFGHAVKRVLEAGA